MQHVLQKVVNDAGRLQHADETRFEAGKDFLTGITLAFEHLTIRIRVVPEDDTISIDIGVLSSPQDGVTTSADARSPWLPAYGTHCIWAWTLTNQQGYLDGLRLEFLSGTRSRVVEMVVAASQIQYYVVDRERQQTQSDLYALQPPIQSIQVEHAIPTRNKDG